MAFYDKFPYTNFQELNLDKILNDVGEIQRAEETSTAAAESAAESAQIAQNSEESAVSSAESALESKNAAQLALTRIGTTTSGIVSDWLNNNIDPTTLTPPLDKSLTVETAAAEAEAAGISINNTNNTLLQYVDRALGYSCLNLFNEPDLVLGDITDTGQETTSTTTYRNRWYYRIPDGTTTLKRNYTCGICFYDLHYNFITRDNGSTDVTVPARSKFYRVRVGVDVITAHPNAMIITGASEIPSVYEPFFPIYTKSSRLKIRNLISENLFDVTDFEEGGISGAGNPVATDTTMRSVSFKGLIQPDPIYVNYTTYFCFYDSRQNFISRVVCNAGESVTAPVTAVYYKLVIATNIFKAHRNDMSVRFRKLETEHNCNRPGRNFWIYRFGGEGNDWCFVRTPADYDPKRQIPYKFIIFNHGNGITMDGSEFKATYTPRTMYLDPSDPNFSSAYDMIATTDPLLQYSNPTFEKFLEAGYIVCGCENYGDNLFGNNNCRNACVDFYNHMVSNYNVFDYCYMIGASNGALTSINAAYLLQEKVRAMVLQYPITCLINQYNTYAGHQAAIRAAYNITEETPTQDQLIQATLTHDVLHWDKGSYFNSYLPPVKLYYSLGDTIVDANANSLALITALDTGYKIYESVQCTGNHGDVSHFKPVGFLAFISKF